MKLQIPYCKLTRVVRPVFRRYQAVPVAIQLFLCDEKTLLTYLFTVSDSIGEIAS